MTLAGFAKFLVALVLVAVLALGEYYYLGWEFSVAIFYLLPIFVAGHYAGRWAGLIVALVCGITWFVVHQVSVPENLYPHAIAAYWNGLAHLGFFVIFALLQASLESSLEREKAINRNLESLLTLAPYDDRGWNVGSKGSQYSPPDLTQDQTAAIPATKPESPPSS